MQLIKEISKYDFGTKIELAGMLLQGDGHTMALYFEKANPIAPEVIQLSHDKWVELLRQLDEIEVEVLDPANKHQKVVVRKTQRQVEQEVNWRVFRRDSCKCRYCGNDNTPMTVDHIVTWESLGQSVEGNLITACRKCNKTRSNMSYDDWLQSDYYLRVIKQNVDSNGDWSSAHQANIKSGEVAKTLPIRTTLRGR